MKYCLRCCYPENSKPITIFDDEGVCSGCRWAEQKSNQSIDWVQRKNELKEILEYYKNLAKKNNAPFDCIIPISGGKDSHYQAHLMTKIFKMKPLFVTYNHAYNTKLGIQNLTNIVDTFGGDLLRYSTNPKTAKKLSLFMLSKVGDITWHYHAGIMTFPIQTAVHYKIPLIIWGEHGESHLHGMYDIDDKIEFTKKNRQEHLMRGFEPDDILNDSENKEISRNDLAPFFYPSDDEINSIGLRGIYLSNYFPWDEFEHTKFVIENYGFKTFQVRESSFNLYQKVEDFFQDTHNYLKYLKFGYGRCTDHVSIEIRNQRMTRDEGIEMIEKYEFMKKPKNLEIFLKFLGITEKEFLQKISHLRDPKIWEKINDYDYKLLDWIGNHKNDEGVNKVKLPIKEKWYPLKSSQTNSPRDNSGDDELVFL